MNPANLWRAARELVRRRRRDRESLEELDHHLALAIERKRQAGLDAREAARQARLELGDVEVTREDLADTRTGSLAEQLLRDVVHSTRILARAPGTSAVSIGTMGVGIGASALLFALVSGIVLRPLPYPDADRLVRIFDTNVAAGVARAGVASGNIKDWRERARAFDGIAGYYTLGRTLSTDADSEVLLAAQVSGDFFPLMGVTPLLGQTFSEDDTLRAQFNSAAAPIGPDPVVILSHGVWRQRFGGDPQVVGRTVMIERRPFRIVAVMPEHFRAPDDGVQLWIPWNITDDGRPRDQHYLGGVARLRPGVSLRQAEEELNAVARQLGEEYPLTNRGWGVRLSPLADETVGTVASTLWILLAAVGVVLLVTCANVALLALLRGLDRSQETAVRLALGATPGRLLRQFLVESALLAAAGGILGYALAAAGLQVVPRLAENVPRLDEVSMDSRVFLFVACVTIGAMLVSGLPAAWKRAHDSSLSGTGAGHRATASAGHHRLRDAIAIGQIAMAIVLLAGSGLLLRSFQALRDADPGFNPSGVLVAPIFLDTQAYGNGDLIRGYYRTLFERLSALPGVTAVGGATTVPASPLGPDFERPVWPELAAEEGKVPAAVRMVTPGYFQALGLTVAQGRAISDLDSPEAPRVVMLSETLARRLWPAGDAVGKRLVVDYSTAGTYPLEVIGIVGDVRFRGPRSEPLSEIYIPHAQRSYLIMNVVVRSAGDPRALIAPVRTVLREMDPQKPAHGVYPLEDLLSATYATDRQAMVTLAVFAATAVFLAVLGVYGVLSQRVRERSREIGIRVALGASRSRVALWLAGLGVRMMSWGVCVGLIAAWMMRDVLSGLLFGVAPEDPLTAAAAVSCLLAAGVAAMIVPSWRATRIDPVSVLRRG